MWLRVWLFGHEVLTVQRTDDPIRVTIDRPDEEDEPEPPGKLVWPPTSDPGDGSHLIWSPRSLGAEGDIDGYRQ
jgi:hypothetical protein